MNGLPVGCNCNGCCGAVGAAGAGGVAACGTTVVGICGVVGCAGCGAAPLTCATDLWRLGAAGGCGARSLIQVIVTTVFQFVDICRRATVEAMDSVEAVVTERVDVPVATSLQCGCSEVSTMEL